MTFSNTRFSGQTPRDLSPFYVLAPQGATAQGTLPFGHDHVIRTDPASPGNVGMYAYSLIEGIDSVNYNSMMINRHPYGDNTKESIEGTVIDGKKIPGVGSPNSPEAMSVFTISLKTNKT